MPPSARGARRSKTKICLRRTTEATRRRHAQLARERQGPDGRWESNKKKAAVRLARRKSQRLDPLFQSVRAKQKTTQAQALETARRRAEDLGQVTDAASLLGIIADLESLPVTAKLLQETMLPKVLQEAVRRLPAASEAGRRLRQRWRDEFREDVARARDAKALPSAAVAQAMQATTAAAASAPAPMAAPALAAASRLAPALKGPRRAESVSSSSGASSSGSSDGSSSDEAELTAVEGAPQGTLQPGPRTPAGRPGRLGAGAATAGGGLVATPQGKPSRRPPRQSKLTSFLKVPGSS